MWNSKSRNLEEAVLETIAWFSLFSYPPTAFEIWRFLFRPASYDEVSRELASLITRGKLIFADGKYALPGMETAFDERESRYRSSLRKLRRAERATKYLSRFSDVRAVFACNSLSFMNARESSDIDMFVIAKHGAIWRVRFAAVTPYALLGWRPKDGGERDAVCWSFFLSDQSLDLRSFALHDGDPYLAFWGATLLPLYDPESLLARLRSESGLLTQFPQFKLASAPAKGNVRGIVSIPNILEKPLKNLQEKRFPASIRERIGQGTDVVISDAALKFHTNDRRAAFRESYVARLRELGFEL